MACQNVKAPQEQYLSMSDTVSQSDRQYMASQLQPSESLTCSEPSREGTQADTSLSYVARQDGSSEVSTDSHMDAASTLVYSNVMEKLEESEDERQVLLDSLSCEGSDSDSVDSMPPKLSNSSKWWFRDPLVIKNWKVVACSCGFVLFGLALALTGVLLEVFQVVEIIRGVVLVVMGIVVIIPSGFAVITVYIAAKEYCKMSLTKVSFIVQE